MMFCNDPTPITGKTRRVVPSLVTLASSSAMRTDEISNWEKCGLAGYLTKAIREAVLPKF